MPSNSSSRSNVQPARTQSPLRSQSSTPTSTPPGSRPGTSSSNGSTSSTNLDILTGVRVVLQDQPDPLKVTNLQPTSRYFRITVFALHRALSMLETSRGRYVLSNIGVEECESWGPRAAKSLVFKQNPKANPNAMKDYVNEWLQKLRRNAPTVTISDRIQGDGVTQRLDWGNSPSEYIVTKAVLFRVNKILLDNIITAANRKNTANFERSLFFLTLTIAHELIHVFTGYITGDALRNTPPAVNHPRGLSGSMRPGEAGRAWERGFIGYITKSYFDSNDPLGTAQAGIMYACEVETRGYVIKQAWIKQFLQGNVTTLTLQNGLEVNASGKPVALTSAMKTMESTRPSGKQKGTDDVYETIDVINELPLVRVGSAELKSILGIATDMTKIMAAQRNVG
ncbi:hypothetical protein J7T55_006062 [Diaporthe amygdali]|uniref:uncharacterized protein n=1 Tax=Phomopsis amygdali TaxID=1214568 RepID=UPI0022FDEE08|nr:uncharacterized protein J7T55_006062 [Diaporthe amygdali]KAJ0124721.1 hypothetical protein J7T55_006062 [Diaporthe amygdali]